jgi:hypothetical protein
MAIYLDEEMIGRDGGEIAYPHLLLCMGITVLLRDGSLVGAHLTNGNSEAGMLAEVANQVQASGVNPYLLYVTGHLAKHFGQGGSMPHEKARAIGYTGDVMVYDTGALEPTDGSFVRVVSNGGNAQCTLYAMRDEEAKPYPLKVGALPGVVRFSGGVTQPVRMYKSGATGVPPQLALKDLRIVRVH